MQSKTEQRQNVSHYLLKKLEVRKLLFNWKVNYRLIFFLLIFCSISSHCWLFFSPTFNKVKSRVVFSEFLKTSSKAEKGISFSFTIDQLCKFFWTDLRFQFVIFFFQNFQIFFLFLDFKFYSFQSCQRTWKHLVPSVNIPLPNPAFWNNEIGLTSGFINIYFFRIFKIKRIHFKN